MSPRWAINPDACDQVAGELEATAAEIAAIGRSAQAVAASVGFGVPGVAPVVDQTQDTAADLRRRARRIRAGETLSGFAVGSSLQISEFRKRYRAATATTSARLRRTWEARRLLVVSPPRTQHHGRTYHRPFGSRLWVPGGGQPASRLTVSRVEVSRRLRVPDVHARGAARQAAKVLGRAGGVLTFGVSAGQQWREDAVGNPAMGTGERVARSAAAGSGAAGSALLGAKIGAGVGAFGGPVGAAVGGIVGGAVGAYLGSKHADKAAELVSDVSSTVSSVASGTATAVSNAAANVGSAVAGLFGG